MPRTELTPALIGAIEEVQQRVLWLATLMIYHANHVRHNPDGVKVGGHQASSASMVTIMTTLYLHYLRPGDRVSVKPHASPVYHALQYLLGRLDARYLTQLRAFGGLQAYPSRTKDPDPPDFSTGSVGLGAVAPAFAALSAQYAASHFNRPATQRFISLVGDAELDEGNVWEAVIDPALAELDNLLWIVDLNRQSLDRVVPGIRAAHLKRLFAESGWRVLEAKYGCRLQTLFAQPGGDVLRTRIDEMSNEEYQALIRLPGPDLRPRLINGDERLARLLATVPDEELPATLANLGGHDVMELLKTLAAADAEPRRPTIIFAYTIKGWGLPIAGNPLNHSMLLTPEQIEALREQFGIAPGHEWDRLPPNSPGGQLCAEAAARLYGAPDHTAPAVTIPLPDEIAVPASGMVSTQDTFGRFLVRVADIAGLRERIVTASPDVSVSTNLAGWINKTGVFARHEEPDFETEAYRMLRWRRWPGGQHIELGISEMNLFMLLGMFGLAGDLIGEPLIPIGTVYDPFVCRGLDAFIYGLYSGARFIVVGTPSGITLSPEGGAHQSSVTASLGIELPNLASFEPCFALETTWLLREALRLCIDPNGSASYLRLSTRPIDQSLLQPALDRLGAAELRQQVLRGGYRLIDRADYHDHLRAPVVQIVTGGTLVPKAVAAAQYLHREGVAVNVINLTSARRVFEQWKQGSDMSWLIPPSERNAPIVTVHDAASHALAWLGSIHGAPLRALGVDQFGQSGARDDLYRAFGLDPFSIAEAAFELIDRYVL
ncbi:transketolase-like TK C-terminal-containing protein [Chloroflexus sp.]